MRALLDTAFLLNEFFYRNPDVAAVRGGLAPPEQLLAAWQQSHEALLALSLQQGAGVYVPEYALLRFMAVLSELGVSAHAVAEELRYWQLNAVLLPVSMEQLVQVLPAKAGTHPSAEAIILTFIAHEQGLDAILSPNAPGASSANRGLFLRPEEVG